MIQSDWTSNHWNDQDDNPAGGSTFGTGFAISWQNGPLGRDSERKEPNGAFVETILAAARDRLTFYQQGKFACAYNANAIEAINDAIAALIGRTESREAREVEGTHAT